MAKSNKFDYTNRKNSGVELGQSIGKALVKEAEKLQKDAEKAATKTRKQSSSSSLEASEVLQDAQAHLINLQAPSKGLGDDGFCALADGLETALKEGTAQASLAVEDLDLSGNDLSTASLARLAPIIELAKHDIKTINLSNNKISVSTDEQVDHWELFLRSFGSCFKLRRLDLSGNRELGDRAYEVFSRVYNSEPPVTPIRLGGDGSVLSLVSEHEDEKYDSAAGDSTTFDEHDDSDKMASGQLLKGRCGLRSIPYITLHATGLTGAGALWLSYILEEHHFPSELLDELNAPPPGTTIRAYQQGLGFGGLDWTENHETLGKDGAYLLQKTETVRRQTLLDDQSAMTGSIVVEGSYSAISQDMRTTRTSVERSRSPPAYRRLSIRSIHTADGGEHEASDLESARKKIQRYVIDHDKVESVDLWRAGLKLVAASRIIAWASPTARKYYIGLSLFQIAPAPIQVSPMAYGPTTNSGRSNKPLVMDAKKANALDAPASRSYASQLTVFPGGNGKVGSPEFALTEVTNSPTTPKVVFKPHRKGAFSESLDLPAVTEKLHSLAVQDHDPARFLKYQQERIDAAPCGLASYRDFEVASHLPEQVMDRVMSFVISKEERRVLSEEQRKAAVAWGQDWATLRTELEWRKRDESSQIWMLLDGVKCLAYGQ